MTIASAQSFQKGRWCYCIDLINPWVRQWPIPPLRDAMGGNPPQNAEKRI